MKLCLICKAKLNLIGEKDNHIIFKCCGCGLGITENLKPQIGSYHRDLEYIKEEELFKNIFSRRVKTISKFIKPGRVLEAGCSTGILLALLKENGWNVTGVEISSKAADEANKRGVNVIEGYFERINLKEKFDLVIFNHTLEHLEDVKLVVSKAKVVLKDGGCLFIDVPNFGGLSAKLLGINWSLLLPNEHLWHFTEQALAILLKDTGFKIIYINKSSGIWNCGDPLKELLTSFITMKKRFFNNLLSALPSLIVSKLGYGSDLMMIAKKIS